MLDVLPFYDKNGCVSEWGQTHTKREIVAIQAVDYAHSESTLAILVRMSKHKADWDHQNCSFSVCNDDSTTNVKCTHKNEQSDYDSLTEFFFQQTVEHGWQ